MLQNARVTAFTISDLLRENQQEGKIISTHTHKHTHTHTQHKHTHTHTHTHTQIRVKLSITFPYVVSFINLDVIKISNL